MVATTTLMDYELNRSSGNYEIDTLLQDVRDITGRNWQVIVNEHRDKRLFSKDRVFKTWRLYVYVDGCLPWQEIMCAHDRDTIFAYLAGVITGSKYRE